MNERTFVGKILISEGQTGNIHSFSCLVKVVPRRCEDRSLPLLMLGGAVGVQERVWEVMGTRNYKIACELLLGP